MLHVFLQIQMYTKESSYIGKKSFKTVIISCPPKIDQSHVEYYKKNLFARNSDVNITLNNDIKVESHPTEVAAKFNEHFSSI